jgi:hypothetical protein
VDRLAWIAAAAAVAACSHPSPHVDQALPAVVDHASVPLIVEGNRPFVELTLKKADGSTRTARFLVDSGGGAFLLTDPLAKDLGVAIGETTEEEGEQMGALAKPPEAWLGSLRLDLDGVPAFVTIGHDSILPPKVPQRADGMFPGRLLAHYHVIFDYPARTFTLAKPGALVPRGDKLAMPVSKEFGFPRTELVVDGVTHGFLLDTGAAFTMVSEVLLKSWGSAHPTWERHDGAYGDATLLGGRTLETMFVPAATWAGRALTNVGVTSQREGTFEKWMSSMMTAPIVGSLAGNVLTRYRIELDYPNQTLYIADH